MKILMSYFTCIFCSKSLKPRVYFTWSQLATLRCQWLMTVGLEHGSGDASNPNTDITASSTCQPLLSPTPDLFFCIQVITVFPFFVCSVSLSVR